MKQPKYKITHSYGNGLIHTWYTRDPDEYLYRVKEYAPNAKLLKIEEAV